MLSALGDMKFRSYIELKQLAEDDTPAVKGAICCWKQITKDCNKGLVFQDFKNTRKG